MGQDKVEEVGWMVLLAASTEWGAASRYWAAVNAQSYATEPETPPNLRVTTASV